MPTVPCIDEGEYLFSPRIQATSGEVSFSFPGSVLVVVVGSAMSVGCLLFATVTILLPSGVRDRIHNMCAHS